MAEIEDNRLVCKKGKGKKARLRSGIEVRKKEEKRQRVEEGAMMEERVAEDAKSVEMR